MPLPPFDRQPPRRILLTCTQRIGDVLLATPVARSLKQAWPEAELHFLLFKGTEGVLAGNPDIDRIIALPHRTGWRGKLAQWRQLWRRYDLAVATIASDRARLYGWVAARFRIGFIADGEQGKSLLLNRWLDFDDRDTHTVSMGLRLTELLGIAPCYEVVPPSLAPEQHEALFARLNNVNYGNFAVLHPSPKFAYKMWRQDGWIALANWLKQQGLDVILTGGPDQDERNYATAIAQQVHAVNMAGALSLAETAALIARAKLFVGPDTAVTHIAAAVGAPTIALFGPSNPIKWGPWPKAWLGPHSPWPWRGGARQGNVFMIQGQGDCVPCLLEGCDRNIDSSSLCLLKIENSTLINAAHTMLKNQAIIPLSPVDKI